MNCLDSCPTVTSGLAAIPHWVLASILLLTTSAAWAQASEQQQTVATFSRHEIWLSAIYANGVPDRRDDFLRGQYGFGTLYESLHKYNSTIPKDKEYGFGATYRYRFSERLSVGAGLGVTRTSQGFASPSDLSYYLPEGQIKTDHFTVRRNYRAYLAQISPDIEYAFLHKENCSAGVSLSVRYSAAFRKTANSRYGQDPKHPLHKVNVREPFATELYPGVFAQVGSVRADFQIRGYHWKYRDDSAENNGLKVDTYNPFKFRLTISYRLLRWPKQKGAEI